MKRDIRKILSVCTSLTLVLSALIGTPGGSVSASAGDYQVDTTAVLPKGINLLACKTGDIFAPAVEAAGDKGVELNETNGIPAEFTNGDTAQGSYVDIKYRNRDSYLIYNLGNKYDITNVFLLARDSTHTEWFPQEYKICIASTKEGLFEDSAVKASFSNSKKEIGQYFTFDKDAIPSGRYVAFMFPAQKINFLGDCSIRLAELGVYTEPASHTEQTDLPSGINLLEGKTGQCFAYAAEDYKELNVPAPEGFTDGTADGGGFIDVLYRFRSTYLIYDLGDEYDITHVLLLGRTDTADYYPQAYQVRVADTRDGLFKDSTVKISYTNENKEKGQYFTLKNVFPRGRYVAFEFPSDTINFDKTSTQSHFLRIGELGVYGNPVYGRVDITSAADSDIPPGSLIAGKDYQLYTNKGVEIPQDALLTSGDYGTFTDGIIDTNRSVGCSYGQYGPMCFVYDLGDAYIIDGVLQISRALSPTRAAVSYNVRVADSMENLFQTDACVLNYTAEDKSDPPQGQLFTLDPGKRPSGRYVAFEMLDASAYPDDDNARIAELAVYGRLTYNYNADDAVDIRDLIHLKKYIGGSAANIDLTVRGEKDPKKESAAALAELRKYILTGMIGKKVEDMYIDNSSLLPKYVPDSQVTVDENGTPDWASEMISAEVRIATATEEGTLKSAVKVLDHYAEMGVNTLWICPVYEPGKSDGNGYCNIGPHSVDPKITGTSDFAEGWKEVGRFVEEAHKRNIRILLDVITWGTAYGAPMYSQHPAWYRDKEVWGGNAFDWKNDEFKEWYYAQLENIAVTTNCDGFRLDCEPWYAGADVIKDFRSRLSAKGRKLFMMAEDRNFRDNAYDCEQAGVNPTSIENYYKSETPIYYFLNQFDLVDSIKNGKNIGNEVCIAQNQGCMYRYYVNTVTCHDNRYPVIRANRLAIGYQAIFSPFLPQWWIGEEWNNPQTVSDVLYFNSVDWTALEQPENRAFYEDVKQMIRIRRTYPKIFAYYPAHFRDTNICKVTTSADGGPGAYARYADGKAIIVVPNTAQRSATVTVNLPFEEAGLNAAAYTVSNAETGEVVAESVSRQNGFFTAAISPQDQGVYLVEVLNK